MQYPGSCHVPNQVIVKNARKDVKNYKHVKGELESKSYCFISGLDIDETLPPTPIEGGYVDLNTIKVSVASIIGLNLSFNAYPTVYEGENNGSIIRNVVPTKKSGTSVSSQGSHLDLFPHVDNPDLRLTSEQGHIIPSECPYYLTLMCLKNTERVPTSLLCLDDVINGLS